MTRSQPRQTPSMPRRSLTVASLDIGRVLADCGGVTFRAQGTCMFPAIRRGDVLRIRSCEAEDVVVGDIAVCRRPEYLFAHRVIGTGGHEGRAYVVTRPDRSRQAADDPTFQDDLLGVVVGIERGGLRVPVGLVTYPLMARRCHGVYLALVEARPRARRWLVGVVVRLQDRQSYRRVAGRWLSRAGPRIRFAVRTPVNATLGDAVFRELAPGEFDPSATWNGRSVDRWTLTASVGRGKEVAGSLDALRDLDGVWRLQEPAVRTRYRGTGLEDLLLQRAGAILERGSASAEGCDL
jgi:hypothetical protein